MRDLGVNGGRMPSALRERGSSPLKRRSNEERQDGRPSPSAAMHPSSQPGGILINVRSLLACILAGFLFAACAAHGEGRSFGRRGGARIASRWLAHRGTERGGCHAELAPRRGALRGDLPPSHRRRDAGLRARSLQAAAHPTGIGASPERRASRGAHRAFLLALRAGDRGSIGGDDGRHRERPANRNEGHRQHVHGGECGHARGAGRRRPAPGREHGPRRGAAGGDGRGQNPTRPERPRGIADADQASLSSASARIMPQRVCR